MTRLPPEVAAYADRQQPGPDHELTAREAYEAEDGRAFLLALVRRRVGRVVADVPHAAPGIITANERADSEVSLSGWSGLE